MRIAIQLSLLIFLMAHCSMHINAQAPVKEKFQSLPFGSIKPSGWIKAQMQQDMQGFVGNLDKLVPDLINDPIYGSGRLHKNSKSMDLGNLKAGDAAGDEQYKWWNSETQSNWWDGYIRNALLLGDSAAISKVRAYVGQVLLTQDEDGYLGIYDKELRYKFSSENGELWSKTTLLRGLLAYYEYTGEEKVLKSIVRAVDNVMLNYPAWESHPFFAGRDFAGGVAHGLTFTDVLDRLYKITGDVKYRDYAIFLYRAFSDCFTSEKDVQLSSILDPNYRLGCHGVHTYEHLRPLLMAAYASGNDTLLRALEIYRARIRAATTVTGGPIGDEWIGGRIPDAEKTGYEYCSIHELLDSYTSLFQKSGDVHAADDIENIFYNAAQGSRDPEHSCIAYLKTDDSYEMMGTRNGEVEPDRNQTRYKYSPAHQDVAVCCNPNAGRITPYFVQSSWLMEGNDTLVAALLLPNILETKVKGNTLRIENVTDYPSSNAFRFVINLENPMVLTLKIRRPAWVKSIRTKEKFIEKDGFIVINRKFENQDEIKLEFIADVIVKKDQKQLKYFTYGPRVFVRALSYEGFAGREYATGFTDYTYRPKNDVNLFDFYSRHNAYYANGKVTAILSIAGTSKTIKLDLLPIGKTVLRQAGFK